MSNTRQIKAPPKLLRADVFHGRKGKIKNAFTYKADYVLLDISQDTTSWPTAMSHDRFNLWTIRDKDYGQGNSTLQAYAHQLANECAIPVQAHAHIQLLTMPACLGFSFNPISFWLFKNKHNQLIATVAEVTNVGRDRHSYLCKNAHFSPITPKDTISIDKAMHVSPYHPLHGRYEFQFDVNESTVNIGIFYKSPTKGGMVANLSGHLAPLSTKEIIISSLRLPFGALRVMFLIYFQALKLKMKGAHFRRRPTPPAQELSK